MKTFTYEETKRNTEYVSKKLIEVEKIAYPNNLFYVLIVHYDPLKDGLDSRVGYFDSRFDAITFAEMLEETYNKFDIPYTIYKN